ncbi:hypothetical protein CR513_57349, partial [Mucuna pruriens]
MDLVKYIFEKPTVTGQIAHWQLALSKYGIIYTNQKAVKWRDLAKKLAHHPLDEYHPLSYEFSDEQIMLTEDVGLKTDSDKWKLWFDGALNMLGSGIGTILASPKGHYFPFLTKVGFDCTNNMAEYEVCTMGITMVIEHQVKRLKLRGEWETRNTKLIPYHSRVTAMGEQFDEISFHYVP